MAKIQNYLSVILIAGLLLLGIFGVLNGLPDSLDITQEGYFLGGTDGFYQAVMVLMPSVYADVYKRQVQRCTCQYPPCSPDAKRKFQPSS